MLCTTSGGDTKKENIFKPAVNVIGITYRLRKNKHLDQTNNRSFVVEKEEALIGEIKI